MDNPWNEKEVPESRVRVFDGIFSLSGRVGREVYVYRYLCFLIVTAVVIGIMSLLYGGVFTMLQSPLGKGVAMALSFLMLTTYIQRAHDIGISGTIPVLVCIGLPLIQSLFFAPKILAVGEAWKPSLVFSMILLAVTWYGHWLTLWPGESHENHYGEPVRNRQSGEATQWEQVKKEYFSFSGRINRKWFIGLSLILGMIIWSSILGGAEGLRMMAAYPSNWQEQVNSSIKILFGIFGILVFAFAEISLIMRRVQDSHFFHFFAHLFILIYLLSLIGKIYLVLFGATQMDSLAQGIKILFSVLVIILEFICWIILCSASSQSGRNDYGANLIEEGLLPGEES